MRHAGQDQTGLFFLQTQTRPVNVVADLATQQGADAGSAGAVAARTGEQNVCFEGGLQHGLG